MLSCHSLLRRQRGTRTQDPSTRRPEWHGPGLDETSPRVVTGGLGTGHAGHAAAAATPVAGSMTTGWETGVVAIATSLLVARLARGRRTRVGVA